MWVASVYYENEDSGRLVIMRKRVHLGAKSYEEAIKLANRITKQGVRIGRWLIPAHRIVSIYLPTEAINERDISSNKEKVYEYTGQV